MADSITLKSNSYDGRYLKLVCEQTNKNSAENTSTIKWTLSTVGGSENYYSTGPTTVIINGTTVYSKSRVAWDDKVFPASIGSKSGTLTVNHNTNGDKSISVSLSTAIYYTTVKETAETWQLDTVPRFATVSHSLSSRTETTITMNWSSDSTISKIDYSSDNGTTWKSLDITDAKSGSYTISGLSANTSYKIKTRVYRKDTGLHTDSITANVTTYDYPYCTKSPDFILGNAVTLSFYNPLKRAFKFYIIDNNGDDIDVEYNCSSTTYTGVNNTASSVPYLYETIPNAKSGKYKVRVEYGNSKKTYGNGNTYSIKESECYPTFSSKYTIKDVGVKTANITNGAFLIKGYSSLVVEIPESAKMTPKNYANPKEYTASFNGVSKSFKHSPDTISFKFGIVDTVGSKEINVKATDTRSLSTLAKKNITVYDYFKPKIYVDLKRVNNFGEVATLKVTGEYEPLIFNNVAKNQITLCQYRYKAKDGEWEKDADGNEIWYPLNATLNSEKGTFICSTVEIEKLSNVASFDFEVQAKDSLENITNESAILDEGQGVFFISSNMKKCYSNGVEVLTIGTAYPVGSVYCNSTNVNPSETFGGEWELIDKGFTSFAGNNLNFFTPADNVTNRACYVTRGMSTIRIRLSLTINAEMSDTGMALGVFNWDEIGITYLPMGYNEQTTYSDGANGGIVWKIVYNTGELLQVDVFDLTPIETGKSFELDFTFSTAKNYMLDDFCDKFYWKRTA